MDKQAGMGAWYCHIRISLLENMGCWLLCGVRVALPPLYFESGSAGEITHEGKE